MIEKDDSFKWGTFHQDLSYHSNEMRPCSFYLRPNNLPLEIISEIRRRDLGLNDGKIGRKKSITVFWRKLQVKFQGVTIKQKQNYLKRYCFYYVHKT